MNKYFFALLVFLLTGCSMAPKQDIASLAPKPNTIKFSRYMITTICYKGNPKCIGPTVKDLEKANVELALAPFSKGEVKGFTAEDKTDLVEQTVPAHADIRVTKNETEPDYNFYVMLRLGKGVKREGKVKTFKIQDPALLKEAKMVEDTMKFKGGTVKVELMLGPPMIITN